MKKKINHLLLSALASSLALTSCSTEHTDSENIQSKGIWAHIVVEAKHDGQSRVGVELNVGGPAGTNIKLSNGEELEVRAGGQSKFLDLDIDFLDIDYETVIDTIESDTEFQFIYHRVDADNVTNNRVFLPESFTLVSPVTNDSFAEDEELNITWTTSNSKHVMDLDVTAACTLLDANTITIGKTYQITDTGSYGLDVSQLELSSQANVSKNKDCDLAITLSRKRTGTLDSQLVGGIIEAFQIRQVEGVKIDI